MIEPKTIFLLFCAFLCINTSYAQKETTKIFSAICQQIDKQNANYLKRNSVKDTDIRLLLDPVSGDQIIEYLNNSKNVAEFKKMSKKTQLEILNATKLPTFPLLDTLYIVDSTAFFPPSFVVKMGKTIFKTVRTTSQIGEKPFMKIYAVAMRENEILFSFSFPNNILLSNYYISLFGAKCTISKTTLVDYTN